MRKIFSHGPRGLLALGIACAALVVSTPLLAQDEVRITANDVAPGIYFLEGDGGNIGVSGGADGTFIIDDQFAELSARIKAALAELNPAPARFVFNTHFHFDHTGGNENFGADGAIIIAHDNVRERMSHDQMISILNVPQPASNPVGLPQITFTDEMTLHFNGHTVNIRHFGPAHTDTDAIYHFVEANVIHTGDVFVRYGYPFVDVPNGGNLNGMIRTMHALIALANDATKIIPGHGALSTKADMLAYVDMLETIRDRVWDGMQQGMTLQQITATEPARGYDNGGFVNAENFTKTVYDSFFK
jgi:glyoxylase-like metal-dependent hydrolase (beta-lactamase superfamily II)